VTSQEPTPAPAEGAAAPAAGGFKKKNLITIGVVTALVWAFAIQTGSVILMSIVGVLTVVLIGVLIWVFRLLRKQRNLTSLLQGSMSSPEARREAIAKLSEGKDAGDVVNVFARAQLVAADDPAAALKMQDDVAILKSQLYLHFGRPRDARPLADRINVDNPQRKDARTMIVGIVAEAWGRTGKHEQALTLLDTVNIDAEKNVQQKVALLSARVFARFASGKRTMAKDDLDTLASIDVNHLGKFLMAQFKVHPELQKLARTVLEKNPTARRMAKAQSPRPRRQ
jgi:hypothetical protein